VVFHDDAVHAFLELRGELPPEIPAARNAVRREADGALDLPRQRQRAGFRNAVHEAEGDQRHGVGVHDSANVRPCAVNGLVKRKLRGWGVQAIDGSVRADADHVGRLQRALVHPRRRDPDVAVLVL